MLLGSTPTWITSSITAAVLSGGFTGRCLFIHREGAHPRLKYRDIPSDYVPDPVVQYELAKMLVPWMLLPHPIAMTMSHQAQTWWEGWYVSHRTTPCWSPLLEGWWPRKPVHVAKLAMVLAASEMMGPTVSPRGLATHRSLVLEKWHLTKALALLNEEERRIPLVLADLETAPEAGVLEWLLGELLAMAESLSTDMVPHSMMLERVRRKRGIGTATRFKQLMATLAEAGRVRITVVSGATYYSTRTKA
jgi:hypothetical protein